MTNEEKIEKMKVALEAKAARFAEIFTTPKGQEVLRDLREEFDGEMLDDNPYKTHYNLGKRDIIVYIEQLIRLHNRRLNEDG